MKYIINKSFFSVEAAGVTVNRNGFAAVDDAKLAKFQEHPWIKDLMKKGSLVVQDSVPTEMKTTAEQLDDAKKAEAAAKKEVVDIKNEALAEIQKRDAQIAALQKQIEALQAHA